MRIELLTDFPQRFSPKATLFLGGRAVTVLRFRQHSKGAVLWLEGVVSREQAEALRDQMLEIPEGELQPLGPGEYYRFQLVGLDVLTVDGDPVGRVEEVMPYPANDVLVVRRPKGQLLLPLVEDVVREVDTAGGRLIIEPVEGLLD